MINFIEYLLVSVFSLFFIIAPYETKYSGKIAFGLGLAALLLLAILKYKGRFYRGLLKINPMNKPFVFFGIACLASVLFSLDIYTSQAVFFDRYVVYFAIFLCGAYLTSVCRKKAGILIYVFLLAGLFFVIGGLRDFFYFSRVNPPLAERLWSVFGLRIPYYAFPLYLSFIAPFSVMIFLCGKERWPKVLSAAISIFSLFCLIVNTSRAALLSVFIPLFLIIMFVSQKNKMRVFFLIVFVFFLFSLAIPGKFERFKTVVSPDKWSARIPLYQATMRIISDYPAFGVGIGMYPEVLHNKGYELSPGYIIPKELNLHAHNTYLEVAAEMGVLGIAAFLAIFLVFLKKVLAKIKGLRDRRGFTQDEAVFIGLAAASFSGLIFAISTTFITVGVNNSAYFWLVFGLASGFLVCPDSDNSQQRG